MRYRIETKDSIRIVGVRVALQEDVEKNSIIIPEFWNETLKSNSFSEICKLTNKIPQGILGVTVYQNPNDIYYYIAAATDKAVPEEMVEFEIPSTTWGICECDKCFPESITTIFKRFYTEWLPFSGYEHAESSEIEVYPINNEKSKGVHSEVWIALKKQKHIKVKRNEL
ncbi:GyrI-like domain-containing protein [Clostridium saccharoperbutylacetonicum]